MTGMGKMQQMLNDSCTHGELLNGICRTVEDSSAEQGGACNVSPSTSKIHLASYFKPIFRALFSIRLQRRDWTWLFIQEKPISSLLSTADAA